MANVIRIKRGTNAALTALASSNSLLPGELYLITDQSRVAVATAVNAFTGLAKLSEAGGAGANYSYNAGTNAGTAGSVPGVNFGSNNASDMVLAGNALWRKISELSYNSGSAILSGGLIPGQDFSQLNGGLYTGASYFLAGDGTWKLESIPDADGISIDSGFVSSLKYIDTGISSVADALGDLDYKLNNNKSGRIYIESLPGITLGVATSQQRIDNTTAINDAFTAGKLLFMRHTSRIELGGAITPKNNTGIIGEEVGGIRPKIYMPAAVFNRAVLTYATRYNTNAVGILMEGGLTTPFTPLKNIVLKDFVLESEVNGDRAITGISARNVLDLIIDGIEIFGLPLGSALNLQSVRGRSFINNPYIHDSYTNTTISALSNAALAPQVTGISIGGDDVDTSIPCDGIVILNPRIYDVNTGAAFRAAGTGNQADAINISGQGTKNCIISNFDFRRTGEGIDCFGINNYFVNGQLHDCDIFGIKLIHGGSFNVFRDINIVRPGIAGYTIAGSANITRDTEGNVFDNINIDNVDPTGVNGADTAGVLITPGTGTFGRPRNNSSRNITINPGANGKFGWKDSSNGTNNNGENIEVKLGALLSKIVYIETSADSTVQFKGSNAKWTNVNVPAIIPQVNVYSVTQASYSPTLTETFLRVTRTSTGPCTITLRPGWRGTIIDAGNNAATNNITILQTPAASSSAASAADGVITFGGTITGLIYPGQPVTGTNFPAGTFIGRQLTGTANGAGTYATNKVFTAAATAATIWSEAGINNSGSYIINTNGGGATFEYSGDGNGWLVAVPPAPSTNGLNITPTTVHTTGNIGAGISTAQHRVHVREDVAGAGGIVVQNATGGGSAVIDYIQSGFNLTDNRYVRTGVRGGSGGEYFVALSNGDAPADRLVVRANGNIYGTAGDPTMNAGFVHVASGAGAPTGTPEGIGGVTPLYYNRTANTLHAYNGGWFNMAGASTSASNVWTAPQIINTPGPQQLIIKDSDTTGDTALASIEFHDAVGARYGYIGKADSSPYILVSATNGVKNEVGGNLIQQILNGRVLTFGATRLITYNNTSPQDGDIWNDGTTFKKHMGGVTSDLAGSGGGLTDGDKGDVVVSNGGTTLMVPLLGSENLGTVAAGSVIPLNYNKQWIGNAAGNTDFRAMYVRSEVNGANSVSQNDAMFFATEVNTTAGDVTYARAVEGYVRLGLSGNTTGRINTARVFEGHIANESNSNIFGDSMVFSAGDVDLQDGTGTIKYIAGFKSANLGHATRITEAAVGFEATDMTGGAPTTVAFRSGMMAGTNKWGYLHNGTANNAFNGKTRFGSNTTPVQEVDISGSLGLDTEITTDAPSTGAIPNSGIRLFTAKRANRLQPSYQSPVGRTERLQTFLGSNDVKLVDAPGAGASAATVYTQLGTAMAVDVGTVAHPAMAITNFLTMQNRRTLSVAATANLIMESKALGGWASRRAVGGGFHYSQRFGLETALPATGRLYCGLTGSTAAMTSADPRGTLTQSIGLVKNSADSTLTLMTVATTAGAAATTVLTNTGAVGWNTAGTVFQIEIFCKAGDTVFGYRVTRWNPSTGATVYDEGTVNPGPVIDTLFVPHLWAQNVAATATSIAFIQAYCETD